MNSVYLLHRASNKQPMKLSRWATLGLILLMGMSTLSAAPAAAASQLFDCQGRLFEAVYGNKNVTIFLDESRSSTTIRNCVFDGWNVRPIVVHGATNVVIENNRFSNIRTGSGFRDIHAIDVPQYGSDIRISGNTFTDVGADGVQLGDLAMETGLGNIHSVRITGNIFTVTNENIGENGIDIKATHGSVIIRENKVHGYRPCEPRVQVDCSGDPTGAGVVVHSGARDVLVDSNRIYNNTNGLIVAAGYGGVAPKNITVVNNMIYDNQKRSIFIDYVESIKLMHNTSLAPTDLSQWLGHLYLYNTPTVSTGWCVNKNNLFAGAQAAMVACNPQGNKHYSDPAQVQFRDLAARNLRLKSTSPAIDQGVPIQDSSVERDYDWVWRASDYDCSGYGNYAKCLPDAGAHEGDTFQF